VGFTSQCNLPTKADHSKEGISPTHWKKNECLRSSSSIHDPQGAIIHMSMSAAAASVEAEKTREWLWASGFTLA
jgi:hypothetical protein